LPFRPSHSVCPTRCSPWLKLPFTTVFIANSSISLKTVAINLMSSIPILPLSQKAILPAMRSHLLPPPWPSRSQAAATEPCPPPWPSCCYPAGTTLAATTAAVLTPPGLTTGEATGQAISHWTAISVGPAMTQAIHTPLGLIPGRATCLLGKAKEAAWASTILRWMMARSLKAAAAAAQAAQDRRFRTFQEESGLSLDNDGEALAPSTPQKAATWCQAARYLQQCNGGAPDKRAAQVEPDPSSSVLMPTLPPHLQMLVSNSLCPAGQDARSTKLPVSLGPSCSPYIEFPHRRSRSRDQMGHVAPGTPPSFIMQDSNFPAMGAQVLSCATVGRCKSGQRLGPSMRQRHRWGIEVVVVLSV
jgi:hypothetical protein